MHLHRHRANLSRPASLVVALALLPGPALAQVPDDAGVRRPPAEAAETPPALALPAGPQVDEALGLARQGRHAEAAERLGALFAATGDDRILYHAGREHVAAGQNALAVRSFQQVLAHRAGDGSLTPHLEAQLAQAKSRTSAVRLRLVDRRTGQPLPPHLLAQTPIVVRAMSPTAGTRPAEFTLPAYDGSPLWLDPGPWSVQVRPPGYRPVELRRSPLWGAGEETWDVAVAPEQVPVTFRVSPTRALRSATLTLTPTGGQAQPLTRPLDRAESTVVLTGGPWQLTVTARRHEAQQFFVATPNMAPLPVPLRRKPRPSGRSFERNEKYLITAGAFTLAEILVGAGVSLAGSVIRQRAHDRNETLVQRAIVDDATGDADGKPALDQVESSYATADYHGDIRRGMNFEAAGIAVLMSGAVTLLPAVTVAERARLRAAYIELGVGAAALGGGAAWLALAVRDRAERLAVDDPTRRVTEVELRPKLGHNVGAAMLTGVGAGLVLFSSVALISEAARRRRRGTASLRAAPLAAPGFSGLSLHGRF